MVMIVMKVMMTEFVVVMKILPGSTISRLFIASGDDRVGVLCHSINTLRHSHQHQNVQIAVSFVPSFAS